MQIFSDKIQKPRNRKPCNGKPRKTREYCVQLSSKLTIQHFSANKQHLEVPLLPIGKEGVWIVLNLKGM